MTHEFPIRVYYEDTDMAGIVYYANYLKYIERARSDWVRSCGIDQNTLRDTDGVVFVVSRIEANYHAPARFDDVLTVKTTVLSASRVRLVMAQDIRRAAEKIFVAVVTLACVDGDGRPVRLPADIRRTSE
ncbi:MAG: tol-pal system-associated acyl-CoA thioesterase [Pseudomonadota bacterium]